MTVAIAALSFPSSLMRLDQVVPIPGGGPSLPLRLYNWGQGRSFSADFKLPQLPWLAAAVCSNWHTRLAAAGVAIKLLPDGLEVQAVPMRSG